MKEYGMGKDEISAVSSLISASKDLFVDSISNQDDVKAQRSLVSLSESSGMGYKKACRIVSDIRAAIGLSPVASMDTGQPSIEPVMKYTSLGDKTLEQNGSDHKSKDTADFLAHGIPHSGNSQGYTWLL